MIRIERCTKCGGNIVTPAFEGDSVYPVGRMCDCDCPRSVEDCLFWLKGGAGHPFGHSVPWRSRKKRSPLDGGR